MFEKYIVTKKEEMIRELQSLIQIPSCFEKSTDSKKPFGEHTNQALESVLALGKKLGFRTKNIDGYCGYIEFGEGEELVGIIGHLDVVPEGDHWTYPPFSGKLVGGNIYGRGAMDDKGPVIASLYAMKTVMENATLSKRVRLILGLNEENDWKCINYYKEKEEIPTIGFSPDADFPGIYAEKSILSEYLKMDYTPYLNQDIIIEALDCHNNAINVVPKYASSILKINSSHIAMNDFITQIHSLVSDSSYEIDLYKIDNERLKITSHGVQAHAAHPDLGVNAISHLLVFLQSIFESYAISIPIFEFFNHLIGEEFNGKTLKIDFEDESGPLTLNVGNLRFRKEDNLYCIEIGMNLRVPVHTNPILVHDQFVNLAQTYPGLVSYTKRIQDALYISPDNYLVKTLCSVYNRVTGTEAKPVAIGGATFARAFPNCISFGANLPGQKDMCHQTDEFISVDNLLLASIIYAEAIYELGK